MKNATEKKSSTASSMARKTENKRISRKPPPLSPMGGVFTHNHALLHFTGVKNGMCFREMNNVIGEGGLD